MRGLQGVCLLPCLWASLLLVHGTFAGGYDVSMAKSAGEKKKPGEVAALAFLASPDRFSVQSVCTVYGDEAFLKSEVLNALRRTLLRGEDSEFALTTLSGPGAQFRDVIDALSTVSLFGDGRQLVIIEDADSFVTEYRAELEDYVVSRPREPSGIKPASARRTPGGLLVLNVKTWPSNTRLAKAVAAQGLTIHCAAPIERELKTWLVNRAKTEHQVRFEPAAIDELFELVPPEIGILVQELSKLALIAGEKRVIDAALVRENVGGWRARATWDLIDAASEGRAAEAILQLDRLITSGENPQGLLPQMAWTLRRFASAAHLIETAEKRHKHLSPREALSQAGVLPFKLSDAERQLRQIGRHRAKHLTEWLLAADLAMKGHNSSKERARIEVERLIMRLSTAFQNRLTNAGGAEPRFAYSKRS